MKNPNLDPHCYIPSSDVIHDPGVLLDRRHLLHCQNMFFPPSPNSTSETLSCCCILVQALNIFRLNYCNSVLSDLLSSTQQPQSSVLHTAACLIKDLGSRVHIMPTLKQLHRLPIYTSSMLKISLLLLMFIFVYCQEKQRSSNHDSLTNEAQIKTIKKDKNRQCGY